MDYRLQINIPLELEEIARKKAYNLGLIRGSKGIVSLYISQLIFKDLESKNNNYFKNYVFEKSYKETKRINIPIPRDKLTEVENRAVELGFISQRSSKPIMTRYIIWLLEDNFNKER